MGLTAQRRNRELAGEAARQPLPPAPVPHRDHKAQLVEQHKKHQLDLLKIQLALGVSHAEIAAIIAAPIPASPEPKAAPVAPKAPEPEPEPARGDKPAERAADDKPSDKPQKKRGK